MLLLSGFMIGLVALEGAGVYLLTQKLQHVRESAEQAREAELYSRDAAEARQLARQAGERAPPLC